MTFTLRICRNCRKSVGMDDVKCKHCKRPLMDPIRYKVVLAIMALILLVALGFLFYGIILYERAVGACAAVNC